MRFAIPILNHRPTAVQKAMTTLTTELSQILPEFEESSPQKSNTQSIESLLANAFAEPIEHPALADSIFPGDRVTILVQNGLPEAREMLASLLRLLERNRIETENILVVVPEAMKRVFGLIEATPADPKTKTPATWRIKSNDDTDTIRFEVHATDDESAASYLAANEQGNPVYVNRSLCDSDVILPLSCLEPSSKRSDCLYPEFSNEETRERFREKSDTPKQRIAEAELANDSLGLFFSIEIICGPGEVIQDIVCGSRIHARKIASDRLESLWHMEADDDCDVVVTTIESVGEKATWNQIVSAVKAAACAVGDGPIVVLSQLKEKPSGKVEAACAAQFEGCIPDSLPEDLQHFASILCERPVYLKSSLPQNLVEGLGLGHVESTESARRILGGFTRPFLIRDGHLRTSE